MRVWWLEKLPAQRASFVWEFISKQTKTVSSILLETVMFHYRGATQIDKSSTFSCTNIHS